MAKPYIDYVTRDYDGFRDAMINLIPLKTPEWTDFSESDMGMVLLELVAYVADILAYQQDVVANEHFISTATQRRSIVNLAKLVGYELAPAEAATTNLLFTFQPQTSSVTIPRGFKVATKIESPGDEEIVFETLEARTLPPGSTTISIPAQEGRTISNEIIGTSNGNADQTFTLSNTPALRSSIQIFVDEGLGRVRWEEVESFTDSTPESLHYTLFLDDQDRARVTFGDNIFGRIPASGARVYATYRVGGGKRGNVGSHTLIVAKSSLPGLLSVTNPDQALGGKDRESIEEARVNAPRNFRTRYQAVSKEDYEFFATRYQDIAKAQAVADGGGSNRVTVYVAGPGGEEVSPATKIQLKDELDERRLLTVEVTIQDTTYIPINVSATITVEDDQFQGDVQNAVENAIDEFFDFDNQEFAKPINRSRLTTVIMNVPGVENVTIDTPSTDVVINDGEIPRKGTVSLTMQGGIA